MNGDPFNIMMTIRSNVTSGKAGLTDITSGLKDVTAESGRAAASTKAQAAELERLAAATARAVMSQDDLAAAKTRASAVPVNVLATPVPAASAAIGAWRGAETAASSLQGAVSGLNSSIGQQAHDFLEGAAASASYQRALDDVRASFNPLFAASLQYERKLEDIAEAERLGAIVAIEAAEARVRAARRRDAALGELEGRGDRSGRFGVTNVSYQIADVAAQMSSGQSPAVALGQQVPQMLGGFGMYGAIAGAVAAVGIPLTGVLLQSGTAAGSLEKRISALNDSIQSLAESNKAARRSLAELSKEFGSGAAEGKKLLEAMAEIERRRAGRSVRDALAGFSNEMVGNPGSSMFGLRLTSGEYGSLRRMFGESGWAGSAIYDPNSVAVPVQQAFDRVKNAAGSDDIDEQIAAVEDLLSVFQSAAAMHDGISKKEEIWLEQILTARRDLQRVKAEDENAAGTAEAKSMTDELSRQLELQRATLTYGEDSAEVTAIRNRHEREAAEEKLSALGVDLRSLEAKRLLNGLIEQQGLAEKLASEERRGWARDQDDRIAAIQRETGLIGATAAQQAHVNALAEAEVEIRERMLTPIEAAEARVNAIARAEAEARQARAQAEYDLKSAQTLSGYDARIDAATNPVAKASLEAQREYTRRVLAREDADIAASYAAMTRADAIREITRAQSDYVRDQDQAMAQLRVELMLMGQSAEVRARVLAQVQAERDIERLGATGDQADRIRSQSLARAGLTLEIEAQADAWQRVQSAGESAIDGILDSLRSGDVGGALAGMLGEIEKGFFDLAIRNPLKNAILGTNLGTWDDVGGWNGVVGRLTGRTTPDEDSIVKAATASMSTPAMTVTATSVTLAGDLSGLQAQLAGSANLNAGPFAGGLAGSGDVQSQVWRFFAGKGLAAHQIAGIMGNVSAESGFNPRAVGDNGDAHGLFQWNDRRHSLFNAIGGRQNIGDIQKQLEFAWQELMTTEAAAMGRLRSSTDVRGATEAFLGFERPSGYSVANPEASHNYVGRLAAAEAALAKFGAATVAAGDQVGTLGPAAATAGRSFEQAGVGAATASQGVGLLGQLLSGVGGLIGGSKGGAISLIASAGAQLLGGTPLFRTGGYTGDGGVDDAAGIVHAGEYVFDAAATRRIGVRNLEAIRSGGMRGFRDGGYVTAGRGPTLPAASASAAPAGAAGDQRHVFEINVAGTGDAQIAAGVRAAIQEAFDSYDRDVFAGRVRMVVNDRWGG